MVCTELIIFVEAIKTQSVEYGTCMMMLYFFKINCYVLRVVLSVTDTKKVVP